MLDVPAIGTKVRVTISTTDFTQSDYDYLTREGGVQGEVLTVSEIHQNTLRGTCLSLVNDDGVKCYYASLKEVALDG